MLVVGTIITHFEISQPHFVESASADETNTSLNVLTE